MVKRLDTTILDLIEQSARNVKAHPLNLGGVGGGLGGVGGPPGGYIGWLPQFRVAYDEVEAATLDTNPSGFNPPSGWSLIDNLNHIRYRLGVLEVSSGILVVTDGTTTVNDVEELRFSGGAVVTELSAGHALVTITASGGTGAALTVEEVDGSPSVTNVDKIIFSGATITSLGSGDVLVAISGGGGLDTAAGDARYLKLDATNDPITGQVTIDVDNLAGSSEAALTILLDDLDTFGYGLYIEPAANIPAYLITHEGYDGLYIDQQLDTPGNKGGASHYISRYSTGASNIVQTQHALIISDDSTGVTFSGGTLKHTYDYSRSVVDINPYVASGGSMLLLDSLNPINNSGRLISLKNQTVEKFYVTGSGVVNIPLGATYNVDGTPHTHGGSLTNSNISPTTSNVTAVAGTRYFADISGLTASRNFVLPVPAVGNEIEISIITGDDTYALILIGDTTVTINGGSAATEWSRLFITGEVVRLVANSITNWQVVTDGRIPCVTRIKNSQSENIATGAGGIVSLTLDEIVTNNASCADTTNDKVKIRRASSYIVTGAVRWNNLSAGATRLTTWFVDASNAVIQIIEGYGAAATYPAQAPSTTTPMAIGDTIGLNVYHNTGATEATYAVGNDCPHLDVTEVLT